MIVKYFNNGVWGTFVYTNNVSYKDNTMEKEFNGVTCRFKSDPELSNVIYEIGFSNGKKYIGQTIQPLGVRMRQHCSDATRKGRQWNILKCRAMRKYKRFDVRVIEHCKTVEELNKREDEIIEEYKSKGQELYNVASGGLNNCKYFGTECVVTDKDFNIVKEFDKIVEAKRWLGGSGKTSGEKRYYLIQKKYYLFGKDLYQSYSVEGHKLRLEDQRKQKRQEREERRRLPRKEYSTVIHFDVIQIDHRRNKVRVMDIKEAEQKFGVLARYAVQQEKNFRAYGYYWMKVETYERNKDNLNKMLNGLDYIYKIDSKGDIVGEYASIKEAALSEGVYEETIRNNIRTHSKYMKDDKCFFMKSSEYHKTAMTKEYIRKRTELVATSEPTKVYEYSETNELIAEHASIRACARAKRTASQRIRLSLTTGIEYKGSYYRLNKK